MRATSINHVSVNTDNLEESVRFYVEVLGMEVIPTYDFEFPVQYLRVGDLQLHLFQRVTDAPPYHHVALTVDDLPAIYAKAKALGYLAQDPVFSIIYELPDGSVQMYLRDPAGNLIEIDWPDVETLDRTALPELTRLVDLTAQSSEGLRATLFLEKQ